MNDPKLKDVDLSGVGQPERAPLLVTKTHPWPVPPGHSVRAGRTCGREQLDKLHTPIFYVTGDKTDIAYENGMDDFKRITKVPAVHTFKDGVSHGGTYSQPNGGDFARVAVAMLKWQLKGEKEASTIFLGPNCGLCKEAGWHVETKGIK